MSRSSATVYSRCCIHGEQKAVEHKGWTFEKCGHTFDVFQDGDGKQKSYVVMVNGTGLKIAETGKKSAAVAAITPELVKLLNANTEKTKAAVKVFDELMIAVGYKDPVAEPETAAMEPEPEPARDPKSARGPVPEKTFIGDVLQGNGWRILFDGTLQRTRVIFEAEPTAAARAVVETAGFYYSRSMNSWNKKLTFKAFRAAQKLAAELQRITAA